MCQGVAAKARANLNGATGGAQTKDGFFYANALTRHLAGTIVMLDEPAMAINNLRNVLKQPGKRIGIEGGIILDTWSDERHVDRKLMDIKSYAFTFLVQSFLLKLTLHVSARNRQYSDHRPNMIAISFKTPSISFIYERDRWCLE
jgi:hypothetical protein